MNKELGLELTEELENGNYREAKILTALIIDNAEKINYHGKRADAIVKNMLQHSHTTSGTKEPTDINLFADEYLRLAYHGFRAKDKSFNAVINTDFDEKIGKVNIVAQDIARVLLNLYNNAFYAISAKDYTQANAEISVTTLKVNDQVEITVRDNGNGIPENIIDKIFQPFFTTKPTGQGTGLGLSLSYDIIKAHGGDIKVKSAVGEGAEFIITIPIK